MQNQPQVKKQALVIGVEVYQGTIAKVAQAENDVKAITAALDQLCIPVTTLLNSQATKSKIESKIRTILSSLGPGDNFYVFYAGHGFADSGNNYLTAWDLDSSDLVGTSVQLKYLYDQIQDNGCNGVIFIDACHSGMRLASAARELDKRFSEQELQTMFAQAKHCAAFSACQDSELSWSSSKLGHGIWTYHLIQALTGNAPRAYDSGRYLTSESLQQYLSTEVPKTARVEQNAIQTPWYAGAQSSTFLIADVQSLLAAKAAYTSPDINDIEFVNNETESVKRLSGFAKRVHREPTKHSREAREFIQRCAVDDIDSDVESIRQRVGKSALFKWAEIKIDESDPGCLITPSFHYSYTIEQDEDDPASVECSRRLTQLTDFSLLTNPKFNQAFQSTFDGVRISHKKALIKDIVEIIESKNLQTTFKLFVPSDFSWCRIIVPKRGQILFSPTNLEFISSGTPEELLEQLFDTLEELRSNHNLLIHPFTLKKV
ncbi:MAG: caspase family protein [Candidatus Obscuribacterales bacterium]|nr:caspase family protein [Candidatus Obscuribacterales bacterium]